MHHPSINRAVALVQKATEVLKVRAYNENEDDGQLRYIQVGGSRGRGRQADQPADTSNLHRCILAYICLTYTAVFL